MFSTRPSFYRLQTKLVCRVHPLQISTFTHEFLMLYLTPFPNILIKLKLKSSNTHDEQHRFRDLIRCILKEKIISHDAVTSKLVLSWVGDLLPQENHSGNTKMSTVNQLSRL